MKKPQSHHRHKLAEISNNRPVLTAGKRCVIKIGSALLTQPAGPINTEKLAQWVQQMAALQASGIEVVLVSSGAIAAGMAVLGWSKRPTELAQLQVAAAVGQMALMQHYEALFQQYHLNTAQVLLTHPCLSNRQRYLNARSALRAMLTLGVVPIVNENDTIVTDEIRFGDNDTLAALVANLIEADLFIILTDQDGLFDTDPRTHHQARLITQATVDDTRLVDFAGQSKGAMGCGGMATKIRAARTAARSGAHTVIVGGNFPNVITRIAQGETMGTLLTAEQTPITARKQWLAGHLQRKGQLFLDDGAVQVLHQAGSSLLPVGVYAIEGEFQRGDLVACVNRKGTIIAQGLINYKAEEARTIMGRSSDQIAALLNYWQGPEMIHRDNLVLLGG